MKRLDAPLNSTVPVTLPPTDSPTVPVEPTTASKVAPTALSRLSVLIRSTCPLTDTLPPAFTARLVPVAPVDPCKPRAEIVPVA